MSQVDDVIALVQAAQRDAGEDPTPPADAQAIAQLRQYAADQLHAAVPESYMAFLQRNDGLAFNGTTIYGATEREDDVPLSFRQINEIFSQSDRGYVLYGQTGDELFAQHVTSGAWHMLDRPSLDVIESFPTFEALLERVLRDACEE
jgi:hypothetical protein